MNADEIGIFVVQQHAVPGHLKQAYAKGFERALEKNAVITLPAFLQRDDPRADREWSEVLNPPAGVDAIPRGVHPNLMDSNARDAFRRYVRKNKTDARMRRAYDVLANSIKDQANIYDARGQWIGLPLSEDEAAKRTISDKEYKALLTKVIQSLKTFH